MLKNAGDLRDHAARERRREPDAARARQALGARTPSRAPGRAGLRVRRRGARQGLRALQELADGGRRSPTRTSKRSSPTSCTTAPTPASAGRSRTCRSRAGRRPGHGHGAPPRPTGSSLAAAVGTGPVDATYKAIDAIMRRPATLLEFGVRAVTEGIDALGEVTVRVHRRVRARVRQPAARVRRGALSHGNGADTDIVVASVKAYLAPSTACWRRPRPAHPRPPPRRSPPDEPLPKPRTLFEKIWDDHVVAEDRAARRCSTSTCTSFTRSRRPRRSPCSASAA